MRLEVLGKEKLFAVLKKLIIVEALAYLAFMGLALVADWGQIYEKFILAKYIRFEIIEFLFLGLSQLVLIFLVFAKSLAEEGDINELLKQGEHEKMEFKASLRWDAKRGQVNKELEKAVMKTVSAFLNSDGGCLLVGINDKNKPLGLEEDFVSLSKPDADGFENHFNNIFNSMLGPEFRRLVKLDFENVDGKLICLVSVRPSQKPAYLKTENEENFYIRTGNVTTPLKMSETATYISSWRQKP